jgi:WD40 repeat protein
MKHRGMSGCWCVAVSPDGRWLAWIYGFQVWVHDTQTGTRRRLATLIREPPATLRFSPDGRTLVVGGYNRNQVWDVPAWTPRSTWDRVLEAGRFPGITRCLAFCPDGALLAAGHLLAHDFVDRRRYDIRLHDPVTGARLRRLNTPTPLGEVTSLSFHPGGRLLAGTHGTSWHVWDVESGEVVVGEKTARQQFPAAAFAPDGRHLALSRSDLTVRFLDTQTWKEKAAFKWNIGRVACLAFSPDGMKLAGGGNKGIVAVWDVDL